MDGLEIRDDKIPDQAVIEAFYAEVFPDEDLIPLVRLLLAEETGILSLFGYVGDALAGHVLFTTCGFEGCSDPVSLLGPLAVAVGRQKQGVGGALVHDGFSRLKKTGAVRVFVLGDPLYYSRFGFAAENDVTPPFDLPPEWDGAWQSLDLVSDREPLAGRLVVPAPWRERNLWAP